MQKLLLNDKTRGCVFVKVYPLFVVVVLKVRRILGSPLKTRETGIPFESIRLLGLTPVQPTPGLRFKGRHSPIQTATKLGHRMGAYHQKRQGRPYSQDQSKLGIETEDPPQMANEGLRTHLAPLTPATGAPSSRSLAAGPPDETNVGMWDTSKQKSQKLKLKAQMRALAPTQAPCRIPFSGIGFEAMQVICHLYEGYMLPFQLTLVLFVRIHTSKTQT